LKLKTGQILIAEPFLGDPNFERSVILICELNAQGAFGLILNQNTEHVLSSLVDINTEDSVFMGGPVGQDTLHWLHTRPDLISGSIDLNNGVYWSGDFSAVKRFMDLGMLKPTEIRFYIGYSGWGAGQLEQELTQKSWIISDINSDQAFTQDPHNYWSEVLKAKGGKYKIISNLPKDLRLN
jgi:putative transcriptional regulator